MLFCPNKNKGVQPPTKAVTVLPFCCLKKCLKWTHFCPIWETKRIRVNAIACLFLRRYREETPLFSTPFAPFFHPICPIEGAGDQTCSETLFATVNTLPANLVVLASAVFAQKETPLGFPFLTAAHSSCSPLMGLPSSGGLRSAQSFFAWESCPKTEGFSGCWSFFSVRSPLLIIPSIMP